MKKWLLLILALPANQHTMAQQALNIMSFNIRYNNPRDSANAWPYRKDLVASQVLFHEADILGVQEALHEQVIDLRDRLPGYNYIGVGRDDGKEKGEYSAIFFNPDRLQLLDSKTFWLSAQPEVPGSKGWDAAITRIVTWGKFKDRKNKKQFYVFNTHFDHMGREARRESAKLLLQKINEIAGKMPVVVTGDFNATPKDEPIQIIVDPGNSLHLIDSRALSEKPHYGPTGTFNGFKSKESSNDPIDYIFIKNGVKVLKHATFSQTWEGRFSSDHFPMFARIVVQ